MTTKAVTLRTLIILTTMKYNKLLHIDMYLTSSTLWTTLYFLASFVKSSTTITTTNFTPKQRTLLENNHNNDIETNIIYFF